ncbi:multiple epidermal growth factor-like domains protein 6 isoform X1 [Mytilus californianus]|uniref:multiple epidermal growth factor-like domains protein 6 isoform X1 n=1 Tax=Mytilus californianus TaxID=6549 RepID=UPI002246F95F|nr:multiple epidermal growth factor-like domains protein 6 isoform X1 [Mytilus californianus]
MLHNLNFEILLLTYVFASGVTGRNHVCTSLVSDQSHQGYPMYRMESTCCLNYHLVNGICQECPAGTYGSRGMCDKPCPGDSYGKFCSLTCDCEENERCDAVYGCTCRSNSSCRDSHLSTDEHMNVDDINSTNFTAGI